jgi:hypothetical protein
LKQRGLNQISFDFGDDVSRYAYENSPESGQTQTNSDAAGDVRDVVPFRQRLSFQDMLLIQRRPE